VIARVADVFRAEWRRVIRRRLLWAGLGLAVLAALLTAPWDRASQAALRLEGTRVALPLNGFLYYADALENGVFVGMLFLVILAGLSLAEEFELGTAKIVFSKPVRRVEVVVAKALVVALLAVLLVGVVAAVAAPLGGALFGYGDIAGDPQFPDLVRTTAAEMARHAAIATALLVPPVAAALLVAFTVGALSEQSGVAVGLAFALIVFSAAGTWLSFRAEPYLVTSYVGFPIAKLRAVASADNVKIWNDQWRGNGPPMVALELLVCGAYAIAAFLVATVAISRRAILGLLVAATLLLAGGEARAGGHKIEFRQDELVVPGQVEDVEITDVDGDGFDDLVVYHTQGAKGPNPRRFLSIFYHRPLQHDFAKTPDQTIEVPAEAAVRFTADVVPAAKGKELGFMGPRGVFCYVATDRRFTPSPVWLVRDEGFFDMSAGNQLPSWGGLVKDMNGDGLADILFLKKGSAVLYMQKAGGGFERAGEIPLDYKQTFGAQVETLLLGRFLSFHGTLNKAAIEDLNGDKLADLVTLHERSIDTYLQRKDGASRFGAVPDRKMPLRVVSEDSATEDEEFNQIRTAIQDVDGDGFPDLIVYRNLGKVSLFESMRTQIIFYRGGPKGWDESKPTQILNLKGISIDPALIDVDGDGKKDLVVSSLRTDLVTNALRALFNSVTISYYVFRWDKDAKKFHETPDFSRDMKIDLSRLEGSGSIPYAYFWGDYDGDGVADLLSLDEEGALNIDPGEATSGFWSGEKLDFPDGKRVRIEVETSNSLKIQDLNHDGRADILLWYYPKKADDPERGQIKLLLSK
jgi:hypothetical protein